MKRPPLERRYRTLLRAYPPGFRRRELLGTLLDAAPAGRTRPTVREAADLVRNGLRARLGRTRSRRVLALAVLVALTGGYVAAALGTRLAWEAAADYPSGDRLAEITGTVFPGTAVDGGRSATGLFFDPMMRTTGDVIRTGHDEDFQFATYEFGPRAGWVRGDYRSWTEQAAGRLTGTGWTVQELRVDGATSIATGEVDDTGRYLVAARDGLSLELRTDINTVGVPRGSFFALATLTRHAPWFVTAAGCAGWLAGGLLGWLAIGWGARRVEWSGATVRGVAGALLVAAVSLAMPLTLFGVLGFVHGILSGGPPFQPFWALALTWGFGCSWLAALLALAAAGVAAVAGQRPADDPHAAYVPRA